MRELIVEVIDLADIDTLEEDIAPCTGCFCNCAPVGVGQPPPPGGTPPPGDGGGDGCVDNCDAL